MKNEDKNPMRIFNMLKEQKENWEKDQRDYEKERNAYINRKNIYTDAMKTAAEAISKMDSNTTEIVISKYMNGKHYDIIISDLREFEIECNECDILNVHIKFDNN